MWTWTFNSSRERITRSFWRSGKAGGNMLLACGRLRVWYKTWSLVLQRWVLVIKSFVYVLTYTRDSRTKCVRCMHTFPSTVSFRRRARLWRSGIFWARKSDSCSPCCYNPWLIFYLDCTARCHAWWCDSPRVESPKRWNHLGREWRSKRFAVRYVKISVP